ncbi:hypothetical protein MAR_025701, partial [Mya arenaria]
MYFRYNVEKASSAMADGSIRLRKSDFRATGIPNYSETFAPWECMMAYSAPSHMVYLILSPIISTLLAFVNMITVYVFCRHFRLASLSLIIIVNICACDIFVCLFSNTFYVANLWHPTYAWTTGA